MNYKSMNNELIVNQGRVQHKYLMFVRKKDCRIFIEFYLKKFNPKHGIGHSNNHGITIELAFQTVLLKNFF